MPPAIKDMGERFEKDMTLACDALARHGEAEALTAVLRVGIAFSTALLYIADLKRQQEVKQ